jgi:thiol:disulfide interchange protein DsbD
LAGAIALIGVAFAAWLFGRSLEAGPIRTAAAAAIVLAAIGLGSWNLAEGGPRHSLKAGAESDASGLKAEAFSLARLAELTSQNKPVFVNLTAAWCITCKVNERLALRSDTIAKAFTDRGIAYLVGDWTNGDKEITAMLRKHGRAGVPLYLLYSGKPGAQPEVLPQLLTQSIILDRLAAIPSAHVKQAKGEL